MRWIFFAGLIGAGVAAAALTWLGVIAFGEAAERLEAARAAIVDDN